MRRQTSAFQPVSEVSRQLDNTAYDNVKVVKENIEHVKIASENIEHVIGVNENKTNINTVADNIADVNTVADKISNINIVADNIADVNTVNDNIDNVKKVSTDISNINTVANSINSVKKVNDNINDVNIVNNNIFNVNTVASNISNINAVFNDINNINTTASNIDSVNTVSDNIADIKYAKTAEINAKNSEDKAKISEINAQKWANNPENEIVTDNKYSSLHYSNKSAASALVAKASEANAKTSEDNAAISASNAKTSETNAASSKTAAAISEINAKTSENNAKISEDSAKASEINTKNSETNAKASETNAAISASNAKTSENNAKNSENKAKEYKDIVLSYVKDNKTLEKFRFIADSEGKTVFSGVDKEGKTLKFAKGFIDVYLNGIYLDNTNYTESDNGLSITLVSPASLNDELSIIAYSTFVVADITAGNVSIADSGNHFSSTNVEGALKELGDTTSHIKKGSFYVGGEINKFYPVVFNVNYTHPYKIKVYRLDAYQWPSWKGVISLEIQGKPHRFYHGGHFCRLIYYSASYNSRLASYKYNIYSSEVILWLEGGGTEYYYETENIESVIGNPDGTSYVGYYDQTYDVLTSIQPMIRDFVPDSGYSNNGNLLVGTTTDNGVDKLQVNGSISATRLHGTADNADKLGGYDSSNFLGIWGDPNGYYQVKTWLKLTEGHGIFSHINRAHFYPNTVTKYGSWRIVGSRSGWHGLNFESGLTLMMNGDEAGFHHDDNGWLARFTKDRYYGTADKADKLTTARTIELKGDVTGSTSFDGTGNVSITATVQDDSHNHIISNVDGLQDALNGKSNTSHNHDSTYVKKNGVVSSGDFNSFTTSGVWEITSTNLPNQPWPDWGELHVILEGTRGAQIFYCDTIEGGTWIRKIHGTGNWLPWERIITARGSGNVLIGTTTDNGIDKLQVNGTAQFNRTVKGIGTGNNYLSAGVQVVGGEGSSSNIKPVLGFRKPGSYGGTLEQTSGGTFQFKQIDGTPAKLLNTVSDAEKLTTPRNINGVAFDGTANINIPSSNIFIADSGNYFESATVEGALQELGDKISKKINRYRFIANDNQTTFSGINYTPGQIDVYLNGVHLDPSDYTAEDKISITLNSNAIAGDEIYIVAFNTFEVANITASNTNILDAGNYFTSTNVEGALQELGSGNLNTLNVGNGKFKVDSNGYVTKPNHPVFDVANSNAGTTGTVIFDYIYVNKGNHYNTTTGKFTAPVTGTYLFYTTYIKSHDGGIGRRVFQKNDVTVYNGRQLRHDSTDEGGGVYGSNGTLQAIIDLNAGDYVTVVQIAGSWHGSANYNYFGGYLIG